MVGTVKLVAVRKLDPDKSRTIETLRLRLMLRKDMLKDAYEPAKGPMPPGRQLELNSFLWDAFAAGDNSSMVRLLKSGADPDFIERKLSEEERGARGGKII